MRNSHGNHLRRTDAGGTAWCGLTNAGQKLGKPCQKELNFMLCVLSDLILIRSVNITVLIIMVFRVEAFILFVTVYVTLCKWTFLSFAVLQITA